MEKLSTLCNRITNSSSLAVGIVFFTLLTDCILYGIIAPILPDILKDLDQNVGKNKTTGTILINESKVEVTLVNSSCSFAYFNTGKQDVIIGFIIALKEISQLFSNFIVGPVIDKIGYDIVMFNGYIVMMTSTLAFAYWNTYPGVFIARALQGIGSAMATTGGMTLIADMFRDDEERGRMLSFILFGMTMGFAIGPALGGVLYQFGGKPAPFLVITAMGFILLILQLCTRRMRRSDFKGTSNNSYKKLLMDPYLLLACSTIIFGQFTMASLASVLPIWMKRTMCAEDWMLGAAFLPLNGGYMVIIAILGCLNFTKRRWILNFLSFFFAAISSSTYPLCKSFYDLFGPGLILGISGAMISTSAYQILGYLADKRHGPSFYGSAYALADAAYCAVFAVGPMVSGALVPAVGFSVCMYILTGISILGILPSLFLRKPLSQEYKKDNESDRLIEQKDEARSTE
uniref:synaptic vesicular amine transporter-like n=1 Tax=Styela clava TaxID=7725 RepID=UPI00193A7165|nr:synaptic vesicular amine transporter-like [Styela clava]